MPMRALRSDRTERVPGLDPRPRAPHLEETLVEHIRHYNEHRPHRGLGLGAPVPGHTTVASPLANIARRSVLGGLIHEYHQLAASSERQPVEARRHRAKAEVMRP